MTIDDMKRINRDLFASNRRLHVGLVEMERDRDKALADNKRLQTELARVTADRDEAIADFNSIPSYPHDGDHTCYRDMWKRAASRATTAETELARVNAELKEAKETLTVAYMAGAARGKDTVLAEAVEIMRRFLSARLTNEHGEYCGWRISGNGSVNQAAEAARAFVEKHAADAESEARNG